MSFFLLGKGPDGDLQLLSDAGLDSRQAAMAELSRLTADPAFDHWDSEVLVMNLEQGTPVLLVRPAETPAQVVESEPAHAEMPAAPPVEPELAADDEPEPELPADDEPEPEAPAPSEPEPEVPAEPESEPAAEVVTASEGASDPEGHAADNDAALAAVIEELGADEAMLTEDAVVVEADEVPAVEADVLLGETVEPVEAVSLRDALQRTAERMEAEGIVAPESVGPATDEADATPEGDLASVPDEPAAWPWDTRPAADAATGEGAFRLSGLEEPAREATPLITAAGDDETFAASRPVILGSYADADPGPTHPEEPAAWPSVADLPTDPAAYATEPVDDHVEVPEAFVEPTVAPQTVETASASDFILDLEPIGSTQTAHEMTCEDCVYVRTCPNKDQRDPKTCGSFQWT